MILLLGLLRKKRKGKKGEKEKRRERRWRRGGKGDGEEEGKEGKEGKEAISGRESYFTGAVGKLRQLISLFHLSLKLLLVPLSFFL